MRKNLCGLFGYFNGNLNDDLLDFDGIQYEDDEVNNFDNTYLCTFTNEPDLTDSFNLPPYPICDAPEQVE